jgi:ParB/RepB/Spo0J family partition protein
MSTAPVVYQSEPVVLLAISQLRESDDNTRTIFDERSLSDLAQSITASGIIQPLLVRILESTERTGEYEIVAGHRRYRAATNAGLREVPCIARRMSDEEAHELRVLENLQREDLKPLDEAEAYQRMFALASAAGTPITPADVAAKIGKSESYVRLRLRILSAEPDVREALRTDKITLGHALEIARLDSSLQAELLKFCLFQPWGKNNARENALSLADLREHIAENIMLVLSDAPFDTNDATLVPEAGACSDCKNRSGNAQTLFSDIEQSDICTMPVCFASKVARHIDVTIEQLTAKGKSVVRLSDDYSHSKHTDKDALNRSQYEAVKKGTKCEDLKTGIYIDGQKRGKTATVCINSKCAVHHPHAQFSSRPDDKEKRAAARKEATVRGRIFTAIYDASATATLTDDHTFALAEYALKRADHNGLMKLAKVLDWPKELFAYGNTTSLRKKLEEIGVKSAVIVAMLASVSSELSVNEFNTGKAERLEALAKTFSVNPTAVRKDVDNELKAKAKKPAKDTPEKAPTPAAKKAAGKKSKAAKKKT